MLDSTSMYSEVCICTSSFLQFFNVPFLMFFWYYFSEVLSKIAREINCANKHSHAIPPENVVYLYVIVMSDTNRSDILILKRQSLKVIEI